MGEEVKIVIDVESSKGAKTVKDFKKDLEKINKESKDVGKTLGSLKAEVDRVTVALEGTVIGSVEYKKLNQELITANREVKNLELGFEALDSENVASEVGSVAGAIGDVSTGLFLLGGNNESMQKMTENIQRAMGVSMALKGSIEGVQSAKKLMNDMMARGGKITKVATVIQKGFNVVMKANPIGLIITAISLLIGGLVLLAKNVKSVGTFFSDLGVKVKDIIDGFGAWKNVILILLGPIGLLIAAWDYFFGEQAKALSEQQKAEQAAFEERTRQGKEIAKQNTERLNAIKAEMAALEEKHKSDQEGFDLEIEINDLLGKSSRALTQSKLEEDLHYRQEQQRLINEALDSWTKYYEDLFIMSGKSLEDFKAQMKGQGIDIGLLEDERVRLSKEANDQVRLSEAKLIDFQIKGHKKVSKSAVKNKQESLDIIEKLENAHLDKQLDKQTREENAIRDKYFAAIALAEKNHLDTTVLEEAQAAELQELRLGYKRNELEAIKEMEDEFAEIERQDKEKAKQKKIDQQEAVFSSAENLLKTAEALNTIFHGKELNRIKEKQSRGEKLTSSEQKRLDKEAKMQKAFAIAQIAIDTAKAISGAVAAGSAIPFPGNIPAIIAGVAAVMSNVAAASQIINAPLPSAADAGGGDIGTSAEAASEDAPTRTQVEGSTLLNDEPNQVVVVESITEGINSVAVIEAQSTFG